MNNKVLRMFSVLLTALTLAGAAVSQKDTSAKMVTGNGLHITTFAIPEGQVIVYLPDDMSAGDTISGTVVAEPAGKTEEERAKNAAELNGYVLEMAQAQVPVTHKTFQFTLPTLFQVGVANAVLRDDKGQTAARANIPVLPTARAVKHSATPFPSDFRLPTLGQQGRPIEILGPFDGNSSNTRVQIGGQDATRLAESPRKLVFESPTSVVGPTQIALKAGSVETSGPYRNLKVQLNAPKTTLRRGESTALTVVVSGLEGIQSNVPLQMDCKGVVKMEGGNTQSLQIHPADVAPGGTYTQTRPLTALQAGAFSVTASVVVQPFDICLEDDNNGNALRFSSTTGEYIFCLPDSRLNGTGTISNTGTTVTLQHNTADRQVHGVVEPTAKRGTASVQLLTPRRVTFTITDRDLRNNTCTCH